MTTKYLLLLMTVSLLFIGCEKERSQEELHRSDKAQVDLSMDNLFAWCVVPFDSEDRSPQARVDMLRELGFTAYAYDWREKHLSEMEEEWSIAKQSGLDVAAVWMWIDGNYDQPDKLSDANERVLKAISRSKLNTQIWVGFHSNYFQDLEEKDRITRGVNMVRYLHNRAKGIGCSLALYNHGDWFGEPANQVKIIEATNEKGIGIVFNFHHAHSQIDRLEPMVDVMLPYLWAVNLNGMSKDGPKILPIGDGEHEASMVKIFYDSGYAGPFGILGHVEDADVAEILSRNLSGLKSLKF